MDDTTERSIRTLREQGCRITPIVTAVLTRLSESRKAQTVPEIGESAAQALGYRVGNPTIYRICERLHHVGVVQRAARHDGIMRYFICAKAGHEAHLHFICSNCLKVQEVELGIEKRIRRFVKLRLRADVQTQHIQVEGLCRVCRR